MRVLFRGCLLVACSALLSLESDIEVLGSAPSGIVADVRGGERDRLHDFRPGK